MEIPQMPVELVAHIFNFLSTKDLLAVSRSSKIWHEMVQPILYSSLKQTRKNAVPQLLRTLLDNPKLAQHFKTLTLTDTTPLEMHKHIKPDDDLPQNTGSLNTTHWAKITSTILDYFSTHEVQENFIGPAGIMWVNPKAVDDWCRSMIRDEANYHFLGSVLLLLLPNVRSLTIQNYSIADISLYAVICHLLQIRQSQHADRPYSLSKLRELNFETRDSLRSTTKMLITMLQVPSLRKLTFWEIDTYNLSKHNTITPSQVRHLVLRGCYFKHEDLSKVLPNCPHLRILKILFRVAIQRRPIVHADSCLATVINNITHLHDHLEHLSVTCSYSYEHAIRGPFPCLNQFRNLRSLETDAYATPFNFTDLPPNLEQLLFVAPDRGTITPFLEQTLHLNHLKCVPKLGGIHLEFHPRSPDRPQTFDWDAKHSFPYFDRYRPSKREDDLLNLTSAYEQRGVTLTVQFTRHRIDPFSWKRNVWLHKRCLCDLACDGWGRVVLDADTHMVSHVALVKARKRAIEGRRCDELGQYRPRHRGSLAKILSQEAADGRKDRNLP